MLAEGSSPRVRGKHPARADAGPGWGLIPAGAGQTRLSTAISGMTEAHPRGCGANADSDSVPVSRYGSSPRVRGKPAHAKRFGGLAGLIPAGAGQTTRGTTWARPRRAHPRGCGANGRVMLWRVCEVGSSPRVRGKPSVSFSLMARCGLIPAGAGQTAIGGIIFFPFRAHPRGCGANGSGH